MSTPREQLDERDAVIDRRLTNLHDQQVAMAVQMVSMQQQIDGLAGQPPIDPEPPIDPPVDGNWLARKPKADAVVCLAGDAPRAKLNEAQKKRTDLLFEYHADRFHDAPRGLGKIYRNDMLIGSTHGVGRAKINLGATGFHTAREDDIHGFTLTGLEFTGHGREKALSWAGGGGKILIEDCDFHHLLMGIVIEPVDYKIVDDVVIRRNILRDQYQADGRSDAHGALLKAVKNGRFTENAVVRNGDRNSQNPDRSHGAYFSPRHNDSDVRETRHFPWAMLGNLWASNCSHGFKGNTGGGVTGDLFIRNAIAFFFAVNGSDAHRNVVLEAQDLGLTDALARGYGFEAFKMDSFTATDNIVANTRTHRPEASAAYAINSHGKPGTRHGNKVYGQPRGRGDKLGTTYHTEQLIHKVDLDKLIQRESTRPRGVWYGDTAKAIQQVQEAAA